MHDRPFLWRAPSAAGSPSVRGRGCFFAVGVVLMASACASPLGGAVRAYEQGRYPEAMDELRAVEADAERWHSAEAARYALYRSLAHLALGDLRATHDWLDRLDRAMAADPRLLSEGDVHRLASARAHLPP